VAITQTLSNIVTLPPAGVRSIVIRVSVCLFVCPIEYLKNHTFKFHLISVYFTCARSSVLLWWQCDKSWTSGFVDDVMFPYDAENRPDSKTTRMFRPVRQVAAAWAKSTLRYSILFF